MSILMGLKQAYEEWHIIYDIHANHKTNTHEHIDKNNRYYDIAHGWFMAECAIHANKHISKFEEAKKTHEKWQFSPKAKYEILVFFGGEVGQQYLPVSAQSSANIYWCQLHSLIRTCTLILSHSLFSLPHASISSFLITSSECNKILFFCVSSFPFNDAMKYASNACYLPAINVHVSFFYRSLSNNLTLIDSAVYYFMTRWHNTYDVLVKMYIRFAWARRIRVRLIFCLFFGQQCLKFHCIAHPRIWSKLLQNQQPASHFIIIITILLLTSSPTKSHYGHLSSVRYCLYFVFFFSLSFIEKKRTDYFAYVGRAMSKETENNFIGLILSGCLKAFCHF